ncbi:hypothetical protein [Thermoactinomyces sp. DSM 45892]|uniref:hypothetical protein n=1 Tax=Thermoactinomyces sp. DSM 45892 TaxID=1882753 RepID=UPI00089AE9A6|nr:hypothetical protein [Thermoactinomyces sp. DSM 45892]SDZ10481.1 hypothetical protein SAMN05444416_113106 [Thermoactinomyces sp. DSM 45892]
MKQRRRPASSNRHKRRVKKPTGARATLPANPPVQEAKSPLSSISLAQMLSGFLTCRSTVQDLSTSLTKVASIMDNTYQFFNLAQQYVGKKKGSVQNQKNLFPNPEQASDPGDILLDDEIPVINLPKNMNTTPNPLIGKLLKRMDLNQIMSFMQSPFVQKLMSSFLSRGVTAQTSDMHHQPKRRR